MSIVTLLNFYSTVHVTRKRLSKMLIFNELSAELWQVTKEMGCKAICGLFSVCTNTDFFLTLFYFSQSHKQYHQIFSFSPLLTHNLTHYLLRKYNGGKNLNMSLNMTLKFISICLAQIAT